MSKKLNVKELKERINYYTKCLEKTKTGTLERSNLQKNISKLKIKLKTRSLECNNTKNKKVNPTKLQNKEQSKSIKGLDQAIKREVWMHTTHKPIKEDINKYKYKNILPKEEFHCCRCGKFTKEQYYINIFDLQKGFVCESCNKKYYNNKAIKILY